MCEITPGRPVWTPYMEKHQKSVDDEFPAACCGINLGLGLVWMPPIHIGTHFRDLLIKAHNEQLGDYDIEAIDTCAESRTEPR